MVILIIIGITWVVIRLIKISFAHWCLYALENSKDKVYSWLWIILPNWRYYLNLAYKSNHKYRRYSDFYWRPNRIRLWRINGYSLQ